MTQIGLANGEIGQILPSAMDSGFRSCTEEGSAVFRSLGRVNRAEGLLLRQFGHLTGFNAGTLLDERHCRCRV